MNFFLFFLDLPICELVVKGMGLRFLHSAKFLQLKNLVNKTRSKTPFKWDFILSANITSVQKDEPRASTR